MSMKVSVHDGLAGPCLQHLVVLLCIFSQCTLGQGAGSFCSFFGNKSPSPQPGLQNCTWYRDSSCCVNEEINSLFSQVQVPANSNGHCRNYITYLMCYVCDPRQSNFYAQERLTVCEDFCNDLLSACQDARLQGVRLGTRYGINGSAYCADRRFQVSNVKENCFTLEESKRTLVASSSLLKPSILLVLLLPLILVLSGSFSMTGNAGQRMTSFLLVAMVVLLVICSPSSGLVDDRTVKAMAKSLEQDLTGVVGGAMKPGELQRLYDTSHSSTKQLNGTAIVQGIAQQMQGLLDDLNFAVGRLAQVVVTARRIQTPTTTPTAGTATTAKLDVNNLPSSVFLDADSRFDTGSSQLSLQYNSTYLQHINFDQSVVKIPESVNRDSDSVYQAIQYSAAIDRDLKALQQRHNVRWTYFGSETGMFRNYPASEWARNFAGFHVDYDPRTRPWYLAASSGPKTIGIFLDCSASMEDFNRWSIAVATVQQIINSLTEDDQFNIICAKGSYYNLNAQFHEAEPRFLSCKSNGMLAATSSNRAQALQALAGESPFGGSKSHLSALNMLLALFPSLAPTGDCQNILVFITDGKDLEPDHYDEVCSDDEGNSGGCNISRLEFGPLLAAVKKAHASSKTRLNVVGIETGNQGSELPGRMACEHDGLYLRLPSTDNIRHQMSPYFSYLSRLTLADESKAGHLTSPYVDATGLGRIVTISRSVYNPYDVNELLGVVGVDAVLDDLENSLLDDQFGLSYAFLMDLDARVIIHPRLKPSSSLVDNPVYPHISDVETYNDLPREMAPLGVVLTSMLAQRTGSREVTGPRFQRRGALEDGVIWKENVKFTYFYSAVPASQYSFAFVLTDSDSVQVQLNRDSYSTQQQQSASYYHEIGEYNSTIRNLIGYTTEDNGYRGIAIARDACVFKLASRCFCDPTDYLLSDLPNITTIHSYFNRDSRNLTCNSGGLFEPTVRETVWLTQAIQDVWMNRTSALQSHVAWTFFGASNGVFRTYPGSRSSKKFDPTQRPWFYETLSNRPSIYTVSSVYLDPLGVGKVLTVSRTIFHNKHTNIASSCSSPTGRSANCACSSHAECASEYCYNLACSNPSVAGVAGVDLRYAQFATLVETVLASTPIALDADRCSHASTECLLVNSAAEIVYSSSFSTVADVNVSQYRHIPLSSYYGSVMLDLLDNGIFEKSLYLNHQGTCHIAAEAMVSGQSGQILSPADQDNYYRDRGAIPHFQNNYGCSTTQVQYRLSEMSEMLLTEYNYRTVDGACERSLYRIVPVQGTDLLLLVIDIEQDRQTNFFNFNCHILNNVGRPGSFKIEEPPCGAAVDSKLAKPTCLTPSGFVPVCEYSSAPYSLVPPPSVLAYICAIHVLTAVYQHSV